MGSATLLREIRTVLFDLDGTLTVPVIDFGAIRRQLGLPEGVSLIHALQETSEEQRAHAMQVIHEAEMEAAHNARANEGVAELLAELAMRRIGAGIVTRNSAEGAAITMERIGIRLEVVISREFTPLKPHPAPVHEALRRLGADAHSALVVGDYIDDLTAGAAAGARTCLVMNGHGPPKFEADLTVPYPRNLVEHFRAAWK